ncbi:MAG: glutamyl-tRNA reductase [Firmicutes bacterium]|nr:glutamyl-tRNA reductase [Alicyclobacillaceae bacterium]MCL6497595.1 glutamyl-tRNA reductase [Bacillota bacterium]
MQFQVVGVSHHTAEVSLRERLSLGRDQVEAALAAWQAAFPDTPLVLVSTCNRTEWYTLAELDLEAIKAAWYSAAGIPPEPATAVDRALYHFRGEAAARHLFRVAAGLDSMVLGESEILGQVKEAWLLAQARMPLGPLNRLFGAAVRLGKRARHETGIGRNALSWGHALVELAERVLGPLRGRRALVVGAGQMAELAGRHLKAAGVGQITVVNRTPQRGARLAEALGGRTAAWEALPQELFAHEVVVAATAAPEPVITRSGLRPPRAGGHRFWFDLGVPRNIEAGIETAVPGLFLYHLDDVQGVVEANRRQREREAERVEDMIDEALAALREELGAAEAGPVIRLLRQKAERIRQEELARAFAKLPDLTAEQRAVVDQATRLILNKFLNDAMVSMREWGGDGAKLPYLEAVRELFRLTEGLAGDTGRGAAPVPLPQAEG